MANVRKIEANTAFVTKTSKLRVAAYCRVSTDVAHSKDEVQLSNYKQNKFYIMLRFALAVDSFQYEW